MAIRRMLSKKIIDTDAFMDMPLSSQALYMHLVLNADDDGFVGSPKKVMRSIGCMNDDIKILMGKRFILDFESGVIVIKHWKIHNLIRTDRYTKTTYQKELSLLNENGNKSYTFVKPLIDNVIPLDNQMDTQVRLVKVSKGKLSKENIVYFENKKVNEIFNEFLKLRKQLKAKNTERAITLLLNELNKYEDSIKIQMIEKSIMNSWKSVFPLNGKNAKQDSSPVAITVAPNNKDKELNTYNPLNIQYYDDSKLNNLFIDFLRQRKSPKVKNTKRAVDGLLKILEPFDNEVKSKMINNSIISGWASVFELKNNYGKDIKVDKPLTDRYKNAPGIR